MSAGVAARVAHKAALAPRGALSGLAAEQLAAVDLLVLIGGELLVGDKRSSFSRMAALLREGLARRPEATFHSVYDGPLY